jgi:hypothetical protein
MACCSSVQCTVKQLYLGNRSELDTCTHTLSCLEWPVLWPPISLTFPPGTLCINFLMSGLPSSTSSTWKWNLGSEDQQDQLGRTSRIFSFDTMRTAYKTTLQQFLSAPGKPLPSCYLATTEGYRDRPTDFHLIRHGQHRNWRVQQFFYCCVYSLSRERVYQAAASQRYTDWGEGFMNYAVGMGSGAIIYIHSFIKMGSAIQKLIGGDAQTHRQHGNLTSLL